MACSESQIRNIQSEIKRSVVLADWSDASRATRYRVFKQVLTVDANFRIPPKNED